MLRGFVVIRVDFGNVDVIAPVDRCFETVSAGVQPLAHFVHVGHWVGLKYLQCRLTHADAGGVDGLDVARTESRKNPFRVVVAYDALPQSLRRDRPHGTAIPGIAAAS